MKMIAKTTNGVTIRVRKKFLDDHSNPQEHKFIHGYHVTISNERSTPVQLISRYWLIKSASGMVKVVEGEGVIGQQPVIGPNSSYQYNSWCPLPVRFGSMSGYYTMVDQTTNEEFNVDIPEFNLEFPAMLN